VLELQGVDSEYKNDRTVGFKLRCIAKQAEISHERACYLLQYWLMPDEIKMLPSLLSQDIIDKKLHSAGFGTMVAADILMRVMQMGKSKAEYPKEIIHGASVKKAVYLLSHEYQGLRNREGKRIPSNRKDLENQWSIYRPVAHLCAAYRLLNPILPEAITFNERMSGFLMFAELLRRFGISHYPHLRKEPTLPPDETWDILIHGTSLPVGSDLSQFPISRLSPDQLQVLRQYKANARC
jgi:hypothetical protein